MTTPLEQSNKRARAMMIQQRPEGFGPPGDEVDGKKAGLGTQCDGEGVVAPAACGSQEDRSGTSEVHAVAEAANHTSSAPKLDAQHERDRLAKIEAAAAVLDAIFARPELAAPAASASPCLPEARATTPSSPPLSTPVSESRGTAPDQPEVEETPSSSSTWQRLSDADAAVVRRGGRAHCWLPHRAGSENSSGRYVTVLKYRGTLRSFDSICYHAGGPLGLGDIEDLGEGRVCIKCPWHHYSIDMATGKKYHQPLAKDPATGKLVPIGWTPSSKVMQRAHEVRDDKDGMYVRLSLAGQCESDFYASRQDCFKAFEHMEVQIPGQGPDGVSLGYQGGDGCLPRTSGQVLQNRSTANARRAPVRSSLELVDETPSSTLGSSLGTSTENIHLSMPPPPPPFTGGMACSGSSLGTSTEKLHLSMPPPPPPFTKK